MKYAFVAVALFSFAAGVLVRDQAQDREARACERAKENADRFGRALAHVLNGGAVKTDDVLASCRVAPIRKEIL